jgi:hypothetical protein
MSQPVASPYANPEIVSRLHALQPMHSAREICVVIWNEFQVRVTRNSVVGRLYRDNITSESKVTVSPQTTRQHSPRVPRTSRSARSAPREPVKVTALRCAEIVPLNIALGDLEEQHCRWPYNDNPGPTTYCGHVKLEDASFWYCPLHFALATGPGTYAERVAQTVVL